MVTVSRCSAAGARLDPRRRRRRRRAASAPASWSRATARSPPTRTSSPPARATRSSARDAGLRRVRRRQPGRGEDRRPRPERRHRAAQGRPRGPDAAAAAARRVRRRAGRHAGRRHRLAVRREAVAVGRRRLGLDRAIDSLTEFQISGAIQTDAAINPGNSGGPLVDGARPRDRRQPADQVALAAAARASASRCPADIVRRSLDGLRENGEVRYAYLGVQSVELYPQLVERFDLPVEQGRLAAGRPARRPGRERRAARRPRRGPLPGAHVLRGRRHHHPHRGQPIGDPDDLSEAVQLFDPGQKVDRRGLPRRREARDRARARRAAAEPAARAGG